jgi:hypothetical protein
MQYRIDRQALAAFVARQVDLVEAAAIPELLAQVVELRLRHESASRDEVRALWLGAGLATHVGLAIFEAPIPGFGCRRPSACVGVTSTS